jgi:hypothetical protein
MRNHQPKPPTLITVAGNTVAEVSTSYPPQLKHQFATNTSEIGARNPGGPETAARLGLEPGHVQPARHPCNQIGSCSQRRQTLLDVDQSYAGLHPAKLL